MIQLCSLWATENVRWSDANWTWDECQLVQEICQTWGTTQFPWFMANWKWSECSASVPVPPVPVVSIGNQPGVDAMTLVQPWIEEPWNPYRAADKEQAEKKRRRLIKLICRIKGQDYEEERTHADFNVTVGDIRMVVKAVKNIDLEVKE